MMYSRKNKSPDKHKHSVKILSGDEKGAVALFNDEEDARAEAIYMADRGVCVIRREPVLVDYL